uniref:Uncharacterized protein n=1 Tax=Marseillevirus LCMAC201 TaxID=2506605 RepID=A0A481YXP1_9VIRU|nr:MAG: hypothetical protein LCMAC201_04880 [Marseillevirus LCMAC201]
MNVQVIAILFIAVLIIFMWVRWNGCTENFDIPLRTSSAWDWNLGPGYGAGYNTGYAMYGIWPANLPKEPWKPWMWGRRPLIFVKPFTPVPQIDYNDAPDNVSGPVSNYNISLLPSKGRVKLAVNGVAGPTLQLDRNRNYYFHVYTPGAAFAIIDGDKTLFEPLEEGTVQLNFDDNDSDVLHYTIPDDPDSGGVIYLNSTRWV